MNDISATKLAAIVRDRSVLEPTAGAVRLGVQVGISATLARRRCPGLELIEFRAKDHIGRFEQVWSVFAKYTPMLETVDFHQAYLDIRKDATRYGGADELLYDLRRNLKRDTGLALEWGGGVDKWMAWIARGYNQFITPQMESLVLSKLPIEVMTLPERLNERMHHFDLHTVANVMSLPAGFWNLISALIVTSLCAGFLAIKTRYARTFPPKSETCFPTSQSMTSMPLNAPLHLSPPILQNNLRPMLCLLLACEFVSLANEA
ncbi:MAG: hypothetical protein IPG71_00410 [bacterium]|nr:hypothetical protein [bacterium]